MAPKITKSQLILLVKPDLPDGPEDETAEQMNQRMDQHLADLEKRIRDISIEFLEWGEIRKEDFAFGLKVLRVVATIHDDSKVSLDKVTGLFYNEEEDEPVMEGVSSCEVEAWNKL
ncbi:hypothetical protein FDP41_003210 [Naegleria fowleri]|uniref:Translation elongation factor EF1B beta/delta subunit guanine nucleotide exchange domain-containing protein n=1 Tax=Naegleria fowleri TaxID=5763 RepID=A0A6A5BVD6_NAEFO|nr:uncharacterized protein FDP41_003210 [Naegleria fowleri]KAF0977888.1 hypothetical protein FDP41_003210 [Naegleria fowleri]CAG4708019.1 unnamed protein product [Naegleria fowleri]